MRMRWVAPLPGAALAMAGAALLAGCGGTSSASPSAVNVLAAENVWGSIASQIAGQEASVQSIITSPAEDPHDYEPTAQDARSLATAQLAIVNGIGYDPWAPKLLAANPAKGRIVLTVGDLLGLSEGDNPHRWYDPADVETVASTIASDLIKLDPKHAGYYRSRLGTFETRDLRRYHQLTAQIKSRYHGVPVGASESIFALQAPVLGLDLATPYSFMKAISEGTDVSPADTSTTQQQITHHMIAVWIYNAQNATPAVKHLSALARANDIPIATVTETLTPAGASFERWQVGQLDGIERALHAATGR
jgi:zinc/manganese transport system substrate-binding protein